MKEPSPPKFVQTNPNVAFLSYFKLQLWSWTFALSVIGTKKLFIIHFLKTKYTTSKSNGAFCSFHQISSPFVQDIFKKLSDINFEVTLSSDDHSRVVKLPLRSSIRDHHPSNINLQIHEKDMASSNGSSRDGLTGASSEEDLAQVRDISHLSIGDTGCPSAPDKGLWRKVGSFKSTTPEGYHPRSDHCHVLWDRILIEVPF